MTNVRGLTQLTPFPPANSKRKRPRSGHPAAPIALFARPLVRRLHRGTQDTPPSGATPLVGSDQPEVRFRSCIFCDIVRFPGGNDPRGSSGGFGTPNACPI